MQTVELRTARLVLDALGPDDAERVAEYCADPELQRFVPVPVPYGMAEGEGFVGAYASHVAAAERGMLWAIRAPQLAGVIELKPQDDGVEEIGFWLGAPHRGRGYMTEAVHAVLDYAFESLGVRRVLWRSRLGNEASAGVARKAGFRYEGIERAGSMHRGEPIDLHRAAILATDSRDEVPTWP